MKFFKTTKVLALVLACTIIFSINIYADPIINDINVSHWAYSYVVNVLNRQLMSTDQNGNFMPNNSIDKFDTVRILARMMGYKYENMTAAEASYYDSVYQQKKSFLQQYSTSFMRWNSSTDKEIAFLMDKGIITEDDLKQFVIRDQNGNEALRALNREEAAVFLIKVIGKKDEALNMSYAYDFLDDASIEPNYKPYVYYFKSKQVVVGEDGKYNPKSAVSRVAMSVLISKVVELAGGNVPVTQYNSGYSTPTPITNTLETISGTIHKYFPSNNALQVTKANGEPEAFRVVATVNIIIDNLPSTITMLQQGMPFTGTLSNGEFIEIKAQSIMAQQTPMPVMQVTPIPDIKVMEGTVSNAVNYDSGQQILVERNVVSPRGEIIPEILTYTLAPGCTIVRGDIPVTFADIAVGEIIKVTVNGNSAMHIVLEERNINIEGGTLVEKRFVETTGTPYFVVENKNGKKYELKITASTSIKRGNYGEVTYDQLRLGDIVDVVAEYDKLISISAYGVMATVDGTIQEIQISNAASTISVLADDNTVKKYTIIPGRVDVYSVKLNDRVRLRLDSLEIENISVLQVAETSFVTGFVQVMYNQSFTLQDISTVPGMTKTIYFDSSTVIMNSRTGEKVNMLSLRNGTKVYVHLSSVANAPAKTITILLE